MLDSVMDGGFGDAPQDAARAFRAALSVMARPGLIERVSGARAPAPVSPAAAAMLLTLCDAETPLFLAPAHNTEDVRAWIAFHVAAPIVAADQAQFALGGWDDLPALEAFSIGTAEYPDRSATLIVEMAALSQDGATLTGPGIERQARLSLPEIEAFRRNRALFPQGLDFYFTSGEALAALPRTTIVEGA
ncbi:phosphonate C-P lyase system protein PhnH [Rhodobacteraceae bacterium D3-12]|nr:phosphonate C-P lyase system protein PhnH [Rhodobacteraceae bacterium D3-12]